MCGNHTSVVCKRIKGREIALAFPLTERLTSPADNVELSFLGEQCNAVLYKTFINYTCEREISASYITAIRESGCLIYIEIRSAYACPTNVPAPDQVYSRSLLFTLATMVLLSLICLGSCLLIISRRNQIKREKMQLDQMELQDFETETIESPIPEATNQPQFVMMMPMATNVPQSQYMPYPPQYTIPHLQ
eukprot:TRINITY_DN15786_c0_g1_i1.p1 TRINITY_DN15786_c0_g1~~TRINITY_DN15786_c0_g1_i1.p1  ORF type:complete len:191 (+),score=20.30 TRINITY_DN15786_c0_g1_i1:198-770(+)